ncbi:MAG: membrane integrity-associated transporter subunit PqiC [Burkholderiales bacterium]|nr:membrane integrity-associated transporter subunit PqiC [Burkholderiales bacterium]
MTQAAASFRSAARWTLVLSAALLTACAGLPERAPAPLRYDFGPAAAASQPASGTRPLLALRVQASPALDSPAMLYRLAYADAQQLRAYSQARWAMVPAELLQQRLRDGLGRQYVLPPAGDAAPRLLHIELEEFSQLFSSAEQSAGLLRLRASLLQRTGGGEQLLAQRELQLQQPAASADAAGGVRALGAATDAAITELVQWLQMQR